MFGSWSVLAWVASVRAGQFAVEEWYTDSSCSGPKHVEKLESPLDICHQDPNNQWRKVVISHGRIVFEDYGSDDACSGPPPIESKTEDPDVCIKAKNEILDGFMYKKWKILSKDMFFETVFDDGSCSNISSKTFFMLDYCHGDHSSSYGWISLCEDGQIVDYVFENSADCVGSATKVRWNATNCMYSNYWEMWALSSGPCSEVEPAAVASR